MVLCYFTSADRNIQGLSDPTKLWCCVEQAWKIMENTVSLYIHIEDTLFVNLFIASQLNWKQKGITITQKTLFPDEETTRLTIHPLLLSILN